MRSRWSLTQPARLLRKKNRRTSPSTGSFVSTRAELRGNGINIPTQRATGRILKIEQKSVSRRWLVGSKKPASKKPHIVVFYIEYTLYCGVKFLTGFANFDYDLWTHLLFWRTQVSEWLLQPTPTNANLVRIPGEISLEVFYKIRAFH